MDAEPPNVSPSPAWEVVPKAVTTIVSLSVLGYFVGWREANAYYSAIGANWAAASVPPLALLQMSANTITAIVFGAFYSLVLLSDKKINVRKLSWSCAAILLVSTLCLGWSQGLFGNLSITGAYALATVGSTLCSVAAGLTLTELYEQTRTTKKDASSGYLWLVFWFVLPGLFWAPDRLGQARALRDADIAVSPLPIVSLEPTPTSAEWRLVQLFQDKALLVQLNQSKADRLFKIVEAKDIKSIRLVPQASTSK
jgi:hypothetical protein